jgi:phosphatidylglycerol:prolipoprotein diacylglycerol transferase
MRPVWKCEISEEQITDHREFVIRLDQVDKRTDKKMYPRIGPFPTYGILQLLGFIAHFLISRRVARRLGLRRRVWIAVSVCYIAAMIPGAKYLFHVRQLEFDPMVIFSAKHYMQGGLWGGLLAYFPLAIAATLLLARKKKAGLDLIAVALPIPWAMAKLGCLFNGCCHGKPCSLPWGIVFPEGAGSTPAGVPLHPTQVYEILLMALLVLVFRLLPSERWRGTMLLWFVGIYGIGRAAIDTFRGDADHLTYIGPITLTQLICLVAAAASIGVLLFFHHHRSVDSSKEGQTPL